MSIIKRFFTTLRDAILHPRMRSKLMFGVLAAAFLALALQFFISYRGIVGNLRTLETTRMEENLQVALNAIAHAKLDLERMSKDYTSQAVAQHIVVDDRDWLDRHVSERISDLRRVGVVAILDSKGRVLTSSEPVPKAILAVPVVAGAEYGVSSSQYVGWNGKIWILAASAVLTDEFSGRQVGTLILIQQIDDSFAALIKRLTNSEIAFTIDDTIAATTDPAIEPVVLEATSAGFLHEGRPVATEQGYSAVSELLGVPGTNSRLVVSLSREPITRARSALLRDSALAAVGALAVAAAIAVLLSLQLGRPLRSLMTAVASVAQGKFDQHVEISSYRRDEVGQLGRAFNSMADQVADAQETLRRAAIRDGLTGLLNHREFFRRLGQEISRAERDDLPMSMLMIDLDHFKGINDTYGHLQGDAVLTEVARMIERYVRDGDVVARYAGDEFAVILPGADAEQAAAIGERVRTGAEEVAPLAGLPDSQAVTISIGVVTRQPGQWNANRTVELADNALYRAKNAGRDRVEIEGTLR